jgi:NADH pyrophosphatase NudC (nudix superfamily)
MSWSAGGATQEEAAMDPARLAAAWQALAEEAISGVAEWRAQHPTATLREIEAAIDEHLAEVRARMLRDAALASAAADLGALAPGDRPACPECGHRLEARGMEARRLTTRHDRTITLTRTRAVCPACGAAHFPPG